MVKAAEDLGLIQRHANWSENFPFTRVGPVPASEKPLVNLPASPPAATRAAWATAPMRRVPGAGRVIDRFFAAAVDAMVAVLRAL